MSERTVVFEALVGSHNYNLNRAESDKDYKVFTLPTFEDLYRGEMYSESVIGVKEDYDYHDIRKLINLFWKSNVNFVETLYSEEIKYDKKNTNVAEFVEELLNMRDEIVRMNLPYLYNACRGMYFNKMKYLEKGTEGTKHLVNKFGYDTKQALHAFRILNFINRFSYTNFSDFKRAIRYDDRERDILLSIKDGLYSLEDFRKFVNLEAETFLKKENSYKSFQENEKVKEKLNNLVFDLVKESLE